MEKSVCVPVLNTGLRGFTVATTKISDVDGAAGKLIYRGYPANELADKASFEETAYLLLYESLPSRQKLTEFKQKLTRERPLSEEILALFENTPKKALPMDVLQAAIPMLAYDDPNIGDYSPESSAETAVRLIAKIASITAAWDRVRNGKKPVTPDPELSHAANFLYMLRGKRPDDETAAFFDAALVLHAEHSFNASTFSARQVASTRAHMYASVAAAIGSLSGELHGGANTRVMQMLLKIGSTEAVEAYVKSILDTGGVIMGLGHAVYQVDDPRAHILAPMSKKMGERTGDTKWYDLSKALEKEGKKAFKEKKGKDIFVNVDFYSASLYYYMGIPIDLFTPVFAVSRIVGWAAHILEEQFGGAAPKPVLYRPESEYIGDYCGENDCVFTPIETRTGNDAV